MARASPGYTAFNTGELSPLLSMAFDFVKYRTGLKRVRNFLPTVQGPIYRRPGSRFIAEVKNSAERTWLARYEHSVDTVFTLEFGHQYVRFYTNRGRVVEAAVVGGPSAITQANPGVVTWNAHGLTDGADYEVSGVLGMVELNGRTLRVDVINANSFTLTDMLGNAIDTTTFGAFTGGGVFAKVYEKATPWTSADLTNADGTFALSLLASEDVIYICRAGYQPRKLIRLSNSNWDLQLLTLKNGPFKAVDYDTATTVYASAATGAGITLNASAAIFTAQHVGGLFLLEQKLADGIPAWEVGKNIVAGDIRRSQGHYYMAMSTAKTGTLTPAHTEGSKRDGDDGVLWEYLHSGYGWARITGYTSGTQVTADVVSRIPAGAVGVGNPTTRWAHGVFSEAEGWPSHVVFFRERLTLAKRSELFFSIPQDYENFAQRDAGVIAADSAFKYDVRSESADPIKWICPADDLLIGTSRGEFALSEISTAEPFGPGNAAAIDGPRFGGRQIAPVKVNAFVLYVQRSGKRVREMRYDSASAGYVALNRTVLAEHIAKGRIVSMDYAPEPDTVVWATCANGDLLSFTFDPEQDVQAWAKHPLGGGGKAECVVCAPSPSADFDDVWMIAQRTIGGVTRRYVEVLNEKFDAEAHALDDAVFLDSCLTATGDADINEVGNLWHLEGQSVGVLRDGARHPNREVTGGKIALQTGNASKVTVGERYLSIAETMSIEAGSAEGTAQGKKKRIHHMIARVFETVKGVLMGPTEAKVDAAGGSGVNAELVTGDFALDWPSGYENNSHVVAMRDDPFPLTIVGLVPHLITQDK